MTLALSPVTTADDLSNRAIGDRVKPSDRRGRDTFVVEPSHLSDLLGGHLVVGPGFSVGHAALVGSVGEVLPLGAVREVLGPDAAGRVASVHDDASGRAAIRDLEGDAVRVLQPPADAEDAVAANDGSGPQPTLTVTIHSIEYGSRILRLRPSLTHVTNYTAGSGA